MALPAIAAGIGAGAQLLGAIGGIFGAGNTAAAQREANAIAMRNYLWQRQLADEQMRMARAGQTDARGNRTEYIDGVGWISRPTETTRGLLSASDSEERQRLTQDAIRRRMSESNQFNTQLQDRGDANAVRSDRVGTQTLDDVRAAMLRKASGQALGSNDNAIGALGVSGLRGGTNVAETLAEVSRNSGNSLRGAMAGADADATTEYNARSNATRGDALNRYLALTRNASGTIGEQARPTSIGDSLSAMLANRAQSGIYGMQGAGRGVVAPTPTTRDNTPMAIAGFGSALSDMLDNEKLMARLSTLFGTGNSNIGTGQKYADAYGRAASAGYSPF